MTYRTDCELLGLDTTKYLHDPQLVKEKFRELALKLHPDVGGDQARFQAVREAYNRVLADSEEAFSRCPDCDGRGIVEQQSGFSVLKQSCARCCGTGKRT